MITRLYRHIFCITVLDMTTVESYNHFRVIERSAPITAVALLRYERLP